MRSRRIVSGLFCILLLTGGPASAELPGLPDKTFVRMAVTVISVDHLKSRCSGPGSQKAMAQTAAWETANGASVVRQAMARLEQGASARAEFAKVRQSVQQQFPVRGEEACKFLTASVTMQDAQFGASRTMAELKREFGVAPQASPGPQARELASERPPQANKRMKDLAAKIEGFGFDSMATMGIGGGIFVKVYPVVLFKDGQALEAIEGLSFAAGLDAHKRAHGDDWTRWRREGGKLQTQTSKGWENLPFTSVYSKLPDGFRLNGRYQSLSGAGNTALGGSDYVAAWSTFDFLPDGRVVRGGGAGGYAAFQDASAAFSGVAPERRGKYRVNGLMLEIAYDDGKSEQYLIVADPQKPRAIWLDGTAYTIKD